jgi:beta-lactamase superfamily II metal-dependent hydrolase
MNCEIEFLPVGDGCKAGDAIVIRYGSDNVYELMIIDGGTKESGKAIVEHIRSEFGPNKVISHVVLTHSDADHASGLTEVLSELTVKNLWLHVPWVSAAAARPYFADKRWTDAGLAQVLRTEYDLIDEIFEIALAKKTINIYQPFAGSTIGPFRVLSPYESVYPLLLPQFPRTPDPDQEAIEAAGWWIGKPPGGMAQFVENILVKSLTKGPKWIQEKWANEWLKDGGITTACNETSVVLYADCEGSGRVLLTGDAGVWGLNMAANYAEKNGLVLQDFKFVQIPHHGSRRNVGPTILNRLLGPIQPESSRSRYTAFVSSPKDDSNHPRKMVLNAFLRRGAKVLATQGEKRVYFGGFPMRPNYHSISQGMPFASVVEDYD